MNPLRPAQITNDPFSTWANSIQDNITGNRVSVSSDFVNKSGPDGQFLSLHPKHKYTPNYTNYRGEWHPTGSYNPGDIVRVLPKRDYIGKAGANPHSLPWVDAPVIGTNSQGGPNITGKVSFPSIVANWFEWEANYYIPIPGTYICETFVPSLELRQAFKGLDNIFWAAYDFDNYTPREKALIPYVRFIDVNYYPVWPELPNRAYLDMSAGNGNGAYGRYWALLSLMPHVVTSCQNGFKYNSYSDFQQVPSGSANYTGSSYSISN